MDNLLLLPEEVIELILQDRTIGVQDLAKLRLVCSFFNYFIANRPSLWKAKILSEYDFMKPEYQKRQINNWPEQAKHIVQTKKYVHRHIKSMSSNYRWRLITLSNCDLRHFKEKCRENDSLACVYIMHFLNEIIKVDPTCEQADPIKGLVSLTTQHYAKIVYSYILQHYLLKSEWYGMIGSGNLFTPDAIAEFAMKWLYPWNATGLTLFRQYIESLVERVITSLLPDHPLRQCDAETKERWRTSMLTENQFGAHHCKEILLCISRILYQADVFEIVEGFKKFEMDEIVFNTDCHRSLMHIMYETIARRCGVKLLLKGTSNHQFLYWRERWTTQSTRYLVDAQTSSMRMSSGRCPFSQHRGSAPAVIEDTYNPTELLLSLIPPIDERMSDFSRHVSVNIVELAYAVAPYMSIHISAITNMYIAQNKNLEAILQHLQTILHGELPVRDREFLQVLHDRAMHAHQSRNAMNMNLIVQVKQRTPNIMYAIGLICRHLQFGYTCVITGWDPICRASQEWQQTMRVDRLPRGNQQPFYHVVAEDRSERYVAQENLQYLKSPPRLDSLEDKICVDFTHFNFYVYVPNDEKLLEYPDDPAHISFFVNKMRRQQPE